jgi:uncharacterized membrane protein YccC
VLLALALNLANPWWAGISAISILQSERRSTVRRALDRMLGTVIGALVALCLAPLVAWHIPFALACAAVAGFTLYGQERSDHSYAVLLGGVTALLVLFGTLQEPSQALHLAVYRTFEVVAGIVAGSIVSYVLHPAGDVAVLMPAKPGIFARPVDKELLGVALLGALAIAVIPHIWTAFDLPALGQTPITAFVVMTALRGEPHLKALARLVGCGMGGLFGLVAMGAVGGSVVPWLLWLGLGLYVASFLQHGGGDASYVGQQAAIALVMAMVTGEAASPDLTPAIDRLVGVAGGVIIVTLVAAIFGPLRLYLFDRARTEPAGA